MKADTLDLVGLFEVPPLGRRADYLVPAGTG